MEGTSPAPFSPDAEPSQVVLRRGLLAGRTFASLRHPAYRLYFFGQMVSLIGLWMQSAAQSWLVYDLTRSKAFLGVVGIAGSLPIVALSTWGGVLADRIPKRRILVFTSVSAAVLALTLGLLTLAGITRPGHILVLAALLGVVSGLEMPARQAFAAELVGRGDLANAIALNASVFHAARIVGPAIAGVIIGQVGTGWAFVGNALSFGAILFALARMRLPDGGPPRPRTDGDGLWKGFAVVRQTAGLAALMLLMLLVGVFGWSYVVLMPALARDGLGSGPEGDGLLGAAIGVGSVTGALTLAALGRIRRPRAVLCGVVAGLGLALVVLSLSRVPWGAALALVPAGFCLTIFFSLSNTWVQVAVDDDVRGRVMGVYTAIFGILMPLGALWAGMMAEWIGVQGTIAAGAVLCLLAIPVFLPRLPRSMER